MSIPMHPYRLVALGILLTGLLSPVFVFAQAAPPPAPVLPAKPAPSARGLPASLAEASKLINDGQMAQARAKIDAVLESDPKNPQARFMKGVVQTDQGQNADAMETFRALIQDYPELPEPYNNLAVILAQKGEYEQAKAALELALKTNPDYAIAHENLGDVYARLAAAEYDRVLALDKSNKAARAKLTLVKELYAAPQATTPAKPADSSPTKTQ